MYAQHLFTGVKNELQDLAHSLQDKRFWQTIAATAIGLVFIAIGLNGLLIPNQLMASGVNGIALILYYLIGNNKISLGLIFWLLNLPILWVGWRTMSLRFVAQAIIGVFLSATMMSLSHGLLIPTSTPFMASVIGGVLTGTGVGIYLRFGGSTGGVDIIAAVLRRKFGLPMASTFLSVNVVNFIAGGLISHSLDVAFYSAIAMLVHGKIAEKIQLGFHPRKAAMIVTSKPDEVAGHILGRLNRGVTFLHGSNGMSQKTARIVYTVVNVVELARLKEIIFQSDPNAFVSVSDTNEVIGYRFLSWADEGFEDKKPISKTSPKPRRTSVHQPTPPLTKTPAMASQASLVHKITSTNACEDNEKTVISKAPVENTVITNTSTEKLPRLATSEKSIHVELIS